MLCAPHLEFPPTPRPRAHRLERVLPAFTGRIALLLESPDMHGIAGRIRAHWSDELRIRAWLDSDHLLLDLADRSGREV
jgi:hypothetical protein